MAVYLASFNDNATSNPGEDALAARLETATGVRSASPRVGARLYEGACAVCHRSAARRCSAAGRRWR